MKVAFIGGGAMGGAMLAGMLSKGLVTADRVTVAEILPEARKNIAATYKVKTTADPREAVSSADVVIVSVKPNVIGAVLSGLKGVAEEKLFISIAAGVDLATLQNGLSGVRWVRVMPNIACTLGESASSFTPDSTCTKADIATSEAILNACGKAFMLKDEALLNAATGVAGSGIAYVFLFIEGLADGGVRAGLPRPTALALAAQTVLGASKMVLTSNKHPGVLKDQVCSPGGTTIEAVSTLERLGLRSAVIEAVTAASDRSIALGEKAKASQSKL